MYSYMYMYMYMYIMYMYMYTFTKGAYCNVIHMMQLQLAVVKPHQLSFLDVVHT